MVSSNSKLKFGYKMYIKLIFNLPLVKKLSRVVRMSERLPGTHTCYFYSVVCIHYRPRYHKTDITFCWLNPGHSTIFYPYRVANLIIFSTKFVLSLLFRKCLRN